MTDVRTVVFIHGAFMLAESWGPWMRRFEARGYKCVAPAWPFLDHSVDDLQRAPDPRFGRLGIGEIVDNYASIIRELGEPPILVGHSFGGLFVQMLLDRGIGAAGVAIDPAPPKGVLPGANAVRASLPVIRGWGFWEKVRRMPFQNFQWGWVHTLSEPEQRAARGGRLERRTVDGFARLDGVLGGLGEVLRHAVASLAMSNGQVPT